MNDCLRMHFPMTRNDARRYLRDGTLPDTFRQQVEMFLEFDYCTNRDGRLCMGCVFREWDHECQDDCPACCEPVMAKGGQASDG